jgi:hypothetical protein
MVSFHEQSHLESESLGGDRARGRMGRLRFSPDERGSPLIGQPEAAGVLDHPPIRRPRRGAFS